MVFYICNKEKWLVLNSKKKKTNFNLVNYVIHKLSVPSVKKIDRKFTIKMFNFYFRTGSKVFTCYASCRNFTNRRMRTNLKCTSLGRCRLQIWLDRSLSNRIIFGRTTSVRLTFLKGTALAIVWFNNSQKLYVGRTTAI